METNSVLSEKNSCVCSGFVLKPYAHEERDASPHDHAHKHHHDDSDHEHHHDHHGCSCSHSHAAPEPVHPDMVALASDTTAVYLINNMDCPMEEALIRKRLASVEGITGLEFNLMQRVLTVRHELSSTVTIEDALRSIDMIPEPLGDTRTSASRKAQSSPVHWKKLAAAGVLAALSEGVEFAIEWGVVPVAGEGFSLTGSLPLIFAVAAILLGGLGTYRKGWLAVSNFNLNINALMSVAVTGAVIIGQYPEAAMVMVLFNVSEAIEARALNKARDAISKLLALSPETATTLQPDGSWKDMDIHQVPLGSRVRVKPGERIALDGVVVAGHSAVNQAPITGESIPVEKSEGDTVFAGTINASGSLEFEVTAGASDTTLARIIHAVEEAQGRRAPIQRFVDSFARWYTPAVFLLALLVAVVPPLFMGKAWLDSIYMGLVLLVIGCPCALVISTPVSIVSGMAAATRGGILVKGGMFLEQGRKLRCLALDKTGTLTCGQPRMTDMVALDESDGQKAFQLAASLAARSDHPVSRALFEKAEETGVTVLPVENFEAVPGQGVRGVVDGTLCHLGSLRMMSELGVDSADVDRNAASLEAQG
uniref:heavy metal translocating P-type ATPase n=1 Tax=Mailhella sp. TaxID=1981029 RepID=UPI003AB618F4